MGLKILHSADWHLDSPFSGYSREQQTFLKESLRRVPGQLAQLCRREGCDLVLLSGDLFDGPASPEGVDIVRNALVQMGVPVFVSPGNHDFCGPDSPWVREKWPENVHIFTGGLTSVPVPELSCRVWGAGYRSMDCEALLEDFRAAGEETYRLAVLHGDPMQLHSPYCPVTAAQVRDSGLHYLALGHIHKAGSFRAGDTLCGWPGCPMGRGYDETREKGAYIVTLEGEARLRFVPLDTPRFWEITTDDPAGVLPAVGNGDFYRLTLTGSGEIPQGMERFPNLELIDRRETPADIWAWAGADTLEGAYFRLLRQKWEDGTDRTTVELAAKLSRQLLEGREVIL